ncbi:MAG: DUF4056 domain-containing protein [Phycisphaerales bacterium]|nr:DUF4056 domain-containing protein [Phycisphaerales bacterium]
MRYVRELLAGIAVILLSGCAIESELPRSRLGAIPFPGMFTLYASSDVEDLGMHRYTGWANRPFEPEGARGIVYTCRGGFLDLAHIRLSVDWTRYAWEQTHALMLAGGGEHRFTHEDARFDIVIRLPSWWPELSAAEREGIIDEGSVRIAQRIACEIQAWHEIATWFGWSTVPLVSEDGSSFTWDDLSSHVVGAQIGGRVLKDGDDDYDRRATVEIEAMLLELGAVKCAGVDRASQAVKGRWWKDGTAIRRDLDTGLAAGFKTPWLAPGIDECAGAEPARLEIASLADIRGRDLSGMYELRVTPSGMVRSRIAAAAECPETISVERDFPRILALIRDQMVKRWGEEVDRP